MAIADIATDQFPDALKGVKAVIHTAAPISGRVNDAESLLKVSKTLLSMNVAVMKEAV